MSALEYTGPLTVSGGQIRGRMSEDGTVRIYLGIPYAASPAGERRWRDPQAPEPWKGVLSCTQFGPAPIQQPQKPYLFWTREFIIRDTGYEEDCLTANVWTADDGQTGKPVLVYFYGGGYNTGGSSCEVYDGEQMARRGLVFVSFNRRVGVASLYTSPELDREMPDGHSGNYMLRDSVFLLKWVQQNIAAFGGDPGNVTLMGQSSGAGEINALTVSPMARGLFHRAIAMSMNNLKPLGHPEEWRGRQEEQEMWQTVYPGKSLAEMRAMPVSDMIIRFPKPARPCLDGSVLDVNYRRGLTEGRTASLDLMLGAVAGDTRIVNTCYGIFTGAAALSHNEMIRRLHTFFGEHFEEVARLYHVERDDTVAVLQEIDTDLLLGGMLAVARLRRLHGGGRTYIYYYDHQMPGSEAFGVFHSSEVPYVLDNLSHDRDGLWQEADRAFARRLADMVAGYAASGSPAADWVSASGAEYEILTAEECAGRKMDPDKYAFWMKVFLEDN